MSAIDSLVHVAIESAERGRIPDPLVRWGVRRLSRRLLRRSIRPDEVGALVTSMRESDVALVPDAANEQHYEVPPEFFRIVLGQHLKYSCCHWSPGTRSLDQAEAEALAITAERADLRDGQRVLELGCGWGSLTLWMAERFPATSVTAVTNSRLQERFVAERAADRGLDNVRIVRRDMNEFDPEECFDRVVSVEMFEHMRNWEALLSRVARWLDPDGRLFVHVFRHRTRPYLYRTDPDDWMGRHFFSGGIMPSRDLLARFDRDLRLRQTWDWNGRHYEATANAWCARLDAARDRVLEVLGRDCGRANAERRLHRWRLFFLACAELFGMAGGREWGVSHYLLERRRR